jgi:selenocysteine lyase/cysteine desulfurase
LSSVSFDGIRFPVRGLVDLLSTSRRPRFVVVDGSQAIAHTPPDPPRCDLLIGGTHKWLGSGLPMGVAFVPRQSSREFVMRTLEEMASSGDIDDPLLRFSRQLELGRLEPTSETVGLAPLFTCMAAVREALQGDRSTVEAHETRLSNGNDVRGIVEKTGWKALRPVDPVRSGIVLLESRDRRVRCTRASLLRSAFGERGVTLTVYEGGAVRMSMPAERWSAAELNRLGAVLRHLS